MECEHIFMSMEGNSVDSRLHGARDLTRSCGYSTGTLKSRMKIERLFGVMEVCVNRRFKMHTWAMSGSRASSCKELLDSFVHVRNTLRIGGLKWAKGVYGSLRTT